MRSLDIFISTLQIRGRQIPSKFWIDYPKTGLSKNAINGASKEVGERVCPN